MTTQEAYEGIRAWFTRDGADYAYTKEGKCQYRVGKKADSPLRCAVGCLIPDELYDPYFDERSFASAKTVIGTTPALKAIFPERETIHFLGDAQLSHDNCATRHAPMVTFIAELDVLAESHGLTRVAA